MINVNADDIEKIDEYFKVIDERIVAPIQNTDVRKSCTATLALLFAGIDGLGKLICPKEMYDSPNKRFKIFLIKMGKEYENNSNAIWEVRKSLVHNGINRESYMWASSEDNFDYRNLSKSRTHGFLYINTTQFFSDFFKAKTKLKHEIIENKELRKRAANRLEWLSEEHQEYLDEEIPRPSSPPPVDFICSKNKLNKSN